MKDPFNTDHTNHEDDPVNYNSVPPRNNLQKYLLTKEPRYLLALIFSLSAFAIFFYMIFDIFFNTSMTDLLGKDKNTHERWGLMFNTMWIVSGFFTASQFLGKNYAHGVRTSLVFVLFSFLIYVRP